MYHCFNNFIFRVNAAIRIYTPILLHGEYGGSIGEGLFILLMGCPKNLVSLKPRNLVTASKWQLSIFQAEMYCWLCIVDFNRNGLTCLWMDLSLVYFVYADLLTLYYYLCRQESSTEKWGGGLKQCPKSQNLYRNPLY